MTCVSGLHVAPLAVWDANRGLFARHRREASPWAIEHFAGHADDTYRAEFFLIDTPFVVLYRYAENSAGHRYIDPATGEPAVQDPLVVPLAELPPQHLMGRPVKP